MRINWRPDINSFESQQIELSDLDTILRAQPAVIVEDLATENDGGVVTVEDCCILWMNGVLSIGLPGGVQIELEA